MPSRIKRPRDPVQLAKLVGDIATGQAQETDPDADKDKAAIARGHKGGLKGGVARATSLTPTRRKAIAKKAAATRWGNKK